MLRLSKKADYALIAMKHLALRGDRGSSSAREIAELYDIPIELMAKVLQRLVRRGLLASHQGTRGGYQLARAAVEISVADVIQAIDGPRGPACRAGDAAVLHGALWQRRQPQPSVRMGSGRSGGQGPQAGGGSHWREPEGNRLHERR